MDNSEKKNNNENKSPVQKIISSIFMTIFFLFLMRISRFGIFFFPLLFIGIIPAIEGVRKLIQNKKIPNNSEIRNITPERQLSTEKQILRVAKDENGVVTPALITLQTDIPLEQASKLLDDMVKRGYANIRVTDEGRVKYEFPDFIE